MKCHNWDKQLRTIFAAGSVMEVWPMGNYDEFIPDSSQENSFGTYWSNVHSYLNTAITHYEQSQRNRSVKVLDDVRTAS
jgi:hypothetical protein